MLEKGISPLDKDSCERPRDHGPSYYDITTYSDFINCHGLQKKLQERLPLRFVS